MIVETVPDSPAARAGLEPGDTLLSIDGSTLRETAEVMERVHAAGARPLSVEVDRQGARMHFDMRAEGGRIGVRLDQGIERVHDFGLAIVEGSRHPFTIAAVMARGYARVVSGSERAELSGPVGIVRAVKSTPAPARSMAILYVLVVYLMESAALGVFASAILLFAMRSRRRDSLVDSMRVNH
jgi:hypothetical protein